MDELTFEWDDNKNLANIKKHGISFQIACLVFDDDNYIDIYDFRHSIEEDRYIAIGVVNEVLTVVYTERGENIRLISARLANDEERRIYYDRDI